MARGDTAPNYEKDLTIDKHRLDREFEKHPILHMQYVTLAAQADAAAKRAHEKVKTIKAEITLVASTTGLPGVDKPTVGAIDAYCRTNVDFMAAKEDMVQADQTAAILRGAVDAFRARRTSLENLAQLHFSGYFSSPKAPEGSGYEGQTENRADEKARKKMKGDK